MDKQNSVKLMEVFHFCWYISNNNDDTTTYKIIRSLVANTRFCTTGGMAVAAYDCTLSCGSAAQNLTTLERYMYMFMYMYLHNSNVLIHVQFSCFIAIA